MSDSPPDTHIGFSRPDPRKRPPDPAGTQPKVDPESLHAGVVPARATIATASSIAPDATIPAASPIAPDAPIAGASPIAADASPIAADAPGAISRKPRSTGDRTTPGRPQRGSRDRTQPGRTQGPAARASTQGPRFQFLFGALGAIAVAAVGLAIAMSRAPAQAPEATWSSWEPTSSEVDPAEQIAAHIGPEYRLDNGKQIVRITGGPPTFEGKPLTVGIFRSGQTPAELEGNNVLYQLCGGGKNCSINEGHPSCARGLLIAREALELALYTFRYVSSVEHVIVTIPPPPPGSSSSAVSASSASTSSAARQSSGGAGSSSSSGSSGSGSCSDTTSQIVKHAFLFTPSGLGPELEHPLSATLSPTTPRVSQMSSWPDASAVQSLVGSYMHAYTISETSQAGPVMLLEPPGIGG